MSGIKFEMPYKSESVPESGQMLGLSWDTLVEELNKHGNLKEGEKVAAISVTEEGVIFKVVSEED